MDVNYQLKIKLDIHNSQERKFKYFNGNFSLEYLLSLVKINYIYIHNVRSWNCCTLTQMNQISDISQSLLQSSGIQRHVIRLVHDLDYVENYNALDC